MEYSYLNDTVVMLAATVLAVAFFLRMKLPPILAYLVVGVAVGPFGFGLINDVEHIRTFAEFGVVFLLFSIGLEFSVPLLMRM
ncbi:MAG: cation:proton antiporter, partial [Mariprofundus sp.]|nr:cation:proton antiporter [Mariprofundus sp.]